MTAEQHGLCLSSTDCNVPFDFSGATARAQLRAEFAVADPAVGLSIGTDFDATNPG